VLILVILFALFGVVRGDGPELDEFAARVNRMYDKVLDFGDSAAEVLFTDLKKLEFEDLIDGNQVATVSHAELNNGKPLCVECKTWVDYYDHDGDGRLGVNEFIPFMRELRQWHVSVKGAESPSTFSLTFRLLGSV
jgi:hypothetical protein